MVQRCHQEGFSSKPSNFGPGKWMHFILNQLPQWRSSDPNQLGQFRSQEILYFWKINVAMFSRWRLTDCMASSFFSATKIDLIILHGGLKNVILCLNPPSLVVLYWTKHFLDQFWSTWFFCLQIESPIPSHASSCNFHATIWQFNSLPWKITHECRWINGLPFPFSMANSFPKFRFHPQHQNIIFSHLFPLNPTIVHAKILNFSSVFPQQMG